MGHSPIPFLPKNRERKTDYQNPSIIYKGKRQSKRKCITDVMALLFPVFLFAYKANFPNVFYKIRKNRKLRKKFDFNNKFAKEKKRK